MAELEFVDQKLDFIDLLSVKWHLCGIGIGEDTRSFAFTISFDD